MAAEQLKIVKDGLWGNNVALVQLLGLCPLLAVSGTFKTPSPFHNTIRASTW